jgi:hypothetical protein
LKILSEQIDQSHPIILITRHPDFADDIQTENIEDPIVIYLDLGSSFDASKVGKSDHHEVLEWAASHMCDLKKLPDGSRLKTQAMSTVRDMMLRADVTMAEVDEMLEEWKAATAPAAPTD